MKKIFALILLAIGLGACAAPPTNREAPTNVNTATTATAPAMTEADAIAKEKSIWESIKAKDYDAFAAMLATDSMEVTADGVLDKAGSVSLVKDFEPSELAFSDWKFLSIDKDAWLVTYTVNVKGKFKGKDFPATAVRGSSAWAYRDAKWVAVYHQECDVMNMPPPPPPPATKTSPSPATTPAHAAATSDPIANEKMLWDLLKAGQYDAFGAMLAADSIEVEPNGVYDKAGTIKSVTGVDFSKSVVSDYKSANIDSDAAIVTYMLKTPGAKPEDERHTTIWAMRDGKWLAIFHQGTPVAHSMVTSPGMTMSPSPETSPKMSPSPK